MKKYLFALLLLAVTFSSFAQPYAYRSPLDIPLLLSASCGELRNNHFHSGIDIKTQGVINQSVHSIANGYVSRISVSPSGYGLALYIDHPATGQTSVYGHLTSFAPQIQAYVKEQQYQQEQFKVDLRPNPKQFPVREGDIVAYSGNTGNSGGPHVHFEIRDTKTEEVLDPLAYFKDRIADSRPPEVRGIAAYPVPGRGVINGVAEPLRQPVSRLKSGLFSDPKDAIWAWGLIGLGIKAYDRMDGTSNIYGVKAVSLEVDGKNIFQYRTDHFSFAQTRMINTFTDFADWRLNKSFVMQSFVEPGNRLPFFSQTQNNGYIEVDEERPYQITYRLEDIYGNETIYKFTIYGKKQPIVAPSRCSLVMAWNQDNHYISDPFSLTIPKENLYNDVCFKLSQRASEQYFSDVFTVNDQPVPLDKSGEVKIKMTSDPLKNKQQYGLVSLNKNGKPSWIGGVYKNGNIYANIGELGLQLAVSSDDEAPEITPVAVKKTTGEIRIRLKDNLSGIASYRGTVDGKFALFEHDVKSTLYIYRIDASRIGEGKNHKLVFTATDACGNTSKYEDEFFF